jgi:hypothetical protein
MLEELEPAEEHPVQFAGDFFQRLPGIFWDIISSEAADGRGRRAWTSSKTKSGC